MNKRKTSLLLVSTLVVLPSLILTSCGSQDTTKQSSSVSINSGSTSIKKNTTTSKQTQTNKVHTTTGAS